MANTLERMLDRIYQEGISRAEEKAAQIVHAAEEKAHEITGKAHREAAEIIRQAKSESEKIRKATQSDLELLAVQVLSRLKSEIRHLLVAKTITGEVAAAAADPAFISQVLLRLVASMQSSQTVAVVPPQLREQIIEQLREKLVSGLDGLEIRAGSQTSGFVVVRKDADFELDFSESALLELLHPYLKPALASLFRERND